MCNKQLQEIYNSIFQWIIHTVAVDYIGGQVVSHPKLTNLLLSRAEFDILNKLP